LVTEQPTATAAPTPAPVSQLPDADRARWVPAVEGLRRPVDMGHVGDGRLFIVEQAGLIRIFQEGSLLQEPFLDIRGRVGDKANEQGLLGLAFHPRFSENGFFYLNYTDNRGDTLIARFQVSGDPNRADPDSEKILLHIDQPFPNHNGGGLRFGPEGMLYIGTGDGGSAGDPQGNGQSLDTLLGKILRIDVDGGDPYSIPPDNPFAAGGGRAEIWAYGLRNPWRFAFDPFSGALFIADVGQNQWEEIDLAPAGAGGLNFGWNHREGAHPFATARTEGLIDPIAEYGHSQGCSVTGGLVVNSPSLPHWRGVYLYADYCSGRVWGLWRGPGGEWANAQLYHTDFSVSSFGVDAAGEVYLIDHQGTLYRLEEKP
jgi:glucose/arabinose dehydrogenase